MLAASDVKEQLSIAYAQAVIAEAGCTFSKPSLDRESIDIRAHSGEAPFASIGLQLKATASPAWVTSGDLSFSLSRKNYTDLSVSRIEPAYLVVLVLPENRADWCSIDADQLILRNCAYWLSLKGFPAMEESAATKTVHLPQSQLFNAAVLKEWFNDECKKVSIPS